MDAIVSAEALRALGTPRRQEILRLVWTNEQSASAICEAMPEVTFGAISQHLRVLEGAGLVHVRPQGRQRFYAAAQDAAGPLREWLEDMWGDALWKLKIEAEMEEARRGPRSTRTQ